MPLTGFLDGFNEQRHSEQDLIDKQQVSQLRAVTAAEKLQELETDRLVRGTLAQVFQGPVSAQEGADPEAVMAQRLERAGTQIIAVDPKRGLEFISGAQALKTRAAAAEEQRLKAAAERREAQGGALNSITGADNYQEGMNEFLARGGKLPPWYTGDWEQDAPKVQQMARATMSAKDQSLVDLRQAREEAAIKDARNDAVRTQLVAERDAERARANAERERMKVKEEDREAAAQRERVARQRIATEKDKDDAFRAIEARMESGDFPKVSAKVKSEIATRVANRARKAAAGSDDDFSFLLNKEIDKAAKEDLGSAPRSSLNPMNWFFDNNVPLKSADVPTAPPKAAPGKAVSGKIRGPGASPAGFPKPTQAALDFLKENDNPTTRKQFEEIYGYAP